MRIIILQLLYILYILFQHSPLAVQCTLSITAQSALCPQNKKFCAERQATHAPLHSVASPASKGFFKWTKQVSPKE